MKTHAQAVVIGGGVVGCSILYHLTKLGWHDGPLASFPQHCQHPGFPRKAKEIRARLLVSFSCLAMLRALRIE